MLTPIVQIIVHAISEIALIKTAKFFILTSLMTLVDLILIHFKEIATELRTEIKRRVELQSPVIVWFFVFLLLPVMSVN